MSEAFLCTLSLVVSISARPRVPRTAGEGRAWCNAARWTRPCLALNHPKLCPAQPLAMVPRTHPSPVGVAVLWAVLWAGQGHEGEGSPDSSPSGDREWEQRFLHCGQPKPTAKAYSQFPALMGRGDVCPHGDVPLTGSPSSSSMATCGGCSPKGLPGGLE